MKELENAKLLYDAFIKKPDNKSFLIGFIDYFRYVKNIPSLTKCFDVSVTELKEKEIAYADLVVKSQAEFVIVYNKIKSKYKELNISYKEIDEK